MCFAFKNVIQTLKLRNFTRPGGQTRSSLETNWFSPDGSSNWECCSRGMKQRIPMPASNGFQPGVAKHVLLNNNFALSLCFVKHVPLRFLKFNPGNHFR